MIGARIILINQRFHLFIGFRIRGNSRVNLAEMAANGTSFVGAKRDALGFISVLTYAGCELVLLVFLLIDGVFSYLLTKFASYCELRIPCILCSKLDHALGCEKPGFYRNLLCSNHRSEISSLIACHIHGKLVDGHDMCEECLLSGNTKTQSNTDRDRVLMARFGLDLGPSASQSSLLNGECVSISVGIRLCLCCDKPLKSKQNASRVLQLKSPRSGMAKPNIPLPRHLTHRGNIKKMRSRFCGSVMSHCLGKSSYDPMSHVGYTELKITSDSEPEFPFSDDDEYDVSETDLNKEYKMQSALKIPSAPLAKEMAIGKPSHCSSKSHMQPDVDKPKDVQFLASHAASESDPRDQEEQKVDKKPFSSMLPELISLDDFPPSFNVVEDPVNISAEKRELTFPPSRNPAALSELLSLVDAPSLFDIHEDQIQVSRMKFADGTGNIRKFPVNKQEEILKSKIATTGARSENDQAASEVPFVNLTAVDPTDMGKPTPTNDGCSSNFVAGETAMKGPEAVNGNLKPLPTGSISCQGVDLPSHDISPGMHGHGDQLQKIDSSSFHGTVMLKDSAPIEKAESYGVESPSRSPVSEVDGESIVRKLKQQIEHDKKCIDDLYAELEEERNASEIAANQAMAMITRLQEEKAALHMETLQYLRMMEEQAEYDVDALQKANDLVAEKEKEIQDLEADLEFFRLNFPDETMLEIIAHDSFDLKGKSRTVENTSMSHAKDATNEPPSSKVRDVYCGNEKPRIAKDFEEEKLYISQCLKVLERKFHQVVHTGASTHTSGSVEGAADRGPGERESPDKDGTKANDQMNGNSLPRHKDLPASNGILSAAENAEASIDEDQISGLGDNYDIANGQKPSKRDEDIDLGTLENEITDLNERLEALESDWSFLEHTLNSLQGGEEGLQFVREIAHQLQELRKSGVTTSRSQSVS